MKHNYHTQRPQVVKVQPTEMLFVENYVIFDKKLTFSNETDIRHS